MGGGVDRDTRIFPYIRIEGGEGLMSAAIWHATVKYIQRVRRGVGGRVGGWAEGYGRVMHGRSGMATDLRIPTMVGERAGEGGGGGFWKFFS